MEYLATPEAGLAGLFLVSFLAATLLPGGSEAVFVTLILTHPEQTIIALALATLGNTLGGMSTYGLGRLLPEKVGARETAAAGSPRDMRTARFSVKHTHMLDRWGPVALLLAWAPVVGDALCAAAGWLRLPWLPCLLWMALGKGIRYGVLVLAVRFGMGAFG